MAREAWRLWDDRLSEEFVFSVNPSSDGGSFGVVRPVAYKSVSQSRYLLCVAIVIESYKRSRHALLLKSWFRKTRPSIDSPTFKGPSDLKPRGVEQLDQGKVDLASCKDRDRRFCW